MGFEFFHKTYFTLFSNNTVLRELSVLMTREKDNVAFFAGNILLIFIYFSPYFLALRCLCK